MLGFAVGLACAFGAGSAAAAEGPRDGLFVWRGYAHVWEYNHRYNRLGDFVRSAGCGGPHKVCRAAIVHTGASGTGPDRATALSQWWRVRASGVGFHAASTTLDLSGSEGERVAAAQTISVPMSGRALRNMRDRDRYLALLNGFDLLSRADAEKPVALAMRAGRAQYDSERDRLEIPVSARAELACTTPECMGTEFDYGLTVHVALLGADDQIAVRSRRYGRRYSWPDQPQEPLSCDPLVDSVEGPGPELDLPPRPAILRGRVEAEEALVGFRSIAFRLDGEHHVLEQRTAIYPARYNGRAYRFGLDLLFKNWSAGMQSAREPYSRCSFGEPGSARWRTRLALVQFRAPATVRRGASPCEIRWPGLNRPADDPSAVCTDTRQFPLRPFGIG